MKEIHPCETGDRKPETEAAEEELLRHLDAQISMQRARKKAPKRNRTLFIVSGFLFIVAAAAAALMILEEMLSGQARDGRGGAQSETVSERNF